MSVLGGCEEKNKTPVLDERVCPNCGDEVEVFTVKGRLIDDFACVCVGIYSIRRSRLFRRSGIAMLRKRRQAGHRNIVFDIPMQLVGVPPSPGPDALRPVEHACGVAFPLPSVAHFCTSAQEI